MNHEQIGYGAKDFVSEFLSYWIGQKVEAGYGIPDKIDDDFLRQSLFHEMAIEYCINNGDMSPWAEDYFPEIFGKFCAMAADLCCGIEYDEARKCYEEDNRWRYI